MAIGSLVLNAPVYHYMYKLRPDLTVTSFTGCQSD